MFGGLKSCVELSCGYYGHGERLKLDEGGCGRYAGLKVLGIRASSSLYSLSRWRWHLDCVHACWVFP